MTNITDKEYMQMCGFANITWFEDIKMRFKS